VISGFGERCWWHCETPKAFINDKGAHLAQRQCSLHPRAVPAPCFSQSSWMLREIWVPWLNLVVHFGNECSAMLHVTQALQAPQCTCCLWRADAERGFGSHPSRHLPVRSGPASATLRALNRSPRARCRRLGRSAEADPPNRCSKPEVLGWERLPQSRDVLSANNTLPLF